MSFEASKILFATRKERESIDICFFEPDEIFAERLMEYWMTHGLEKYGISYYSDQQLFLERFATEKARLWVVDSSIKECLPEPLPYNILWFSDNPDDSESVFKYRSAANLLQTILGYLEVNKKVSMQESSTCLVSLYTPVKRSSQTILGITISHILSQKGRILYLNLEGYSGFYERFPETYSKDISDFIYSFYHSKEKFPFYTTNFIYRMGEVDVIPPVLNPINLQEISGEMWKQVLGALIESAMYEFIIVDASDFVQGIFDILQMSRVIISTSQSDAQSERKWQQYQKLLEGLGLEDILGKSHKVVIPNGMEIPSNMERYMPGMFSDYAENLLRKVGILLQ